MLSAKSPPRPPPPAASWTSKRSCGVKLTPNSRAGAPPAPHLLPTGEQTHARPADAGRHGEAAAGHHAGGSATKGGCSLPQPGGGGCLPDARPRGRQRGTGAAISDKGTGRRGDRGWGGGREGLRGPRGRAAGPRLPSGSCSAGADRGTLHFPLPEPAPLRRQRGRGRGTQGPGYGSPPAAVPRRHTARKSTAAAGLVFLGEGKRVSCVSFFPQLHTELLFSFVLDAGVFANGMAAA